jgi:iron-sulfur cluster insertion protein
MTNAPLTLSANAAARLHALSAKQGAPVLLRIAVDGGGCSGFQYRFDLVSEPQDGDVRVEREGAVAVIDDVSVALLAGSEIDFVDELAGAEFRVRNPNARSECGCGVSFAI